LFVKKFYFQVSFFHTCMFHTVEPKKVTVRLAE